MSDTNEIIKIYNEIQSLHVYVYKARCKRLVSRISNVTSILTSPSKTPTTQILTLLKVTLEDIRGFMKQLLTKSKPLAISVLKFGTHEENFVKLNEQLDHCAILLGAPMARVIDDQDKADFEADLAHLKEELQPILKEIVLKRNGDKRATLLPFLEGYLQSASELINEQARNRINYRSRRNPTDTLDISGSDLEFVKTVGRGGFATVWLGKFKKDQQVAIKILNVESSDSTVDDFKLEAEIMRRMVHRNITSCYGIAETERGYCMVMEYLANDSLFTYMKANKNIPPSWSRKIDFALDIARGVAFLHRLGIIHRDLKLSNILLDSELHGKISDFGLSHIKTSQTSVVHLQEAGTVGYMAPETFGANASYSTRSDIYAFGMMLWGISHWEQPFKGIVRDEIKDLVWKERYRPPIDSSVPKAVKSLITLAWTQNAANRPPMKDIEQFISELVFIEGLEGENEIMESDMSTQMLTMKMDDQTVKVPASNKSDIVGRLKENVPQPNSSNSVNNILLVSKKSAPDVDSRIKSSKPVKTYNFWRLNRKMAILIGIIVLLLAGGAVVAGVLIGSNKSLAPQVLPETYITSKLVTSKREVSKVGTSSSITLVSTTISTTSEQTIAKSEVLAVGATLSVTSATTTSAFAGIDVSIFTAFSTSLSIALPLTTTDTIVWTTSTTTPTATPTNTHYCYNNYSNPQVTVFAGTGNSGSQNGPALSALFSAPLGIDLTPTGDLVISDNGNALIRFLNMTTLEVSTVKLGNATTLPGNPLQIAATSDGIYIPVLSSPGSAIYKSYNNGLVLVAGNISARGNRDGYEGNSLLGGPVSVVKNRSDIIVIDTNNHEIRNLDGNYDMHTLNMGGSGFRDGNLSQAQFKSPFGGYFDLNGNLFITDSGNSAIRKITPSGNVSTVCVDSAKFTSLKGIIVDPCNNIIVISQTSPNLVISVITTTKEVRNLLDSAVFSNTVENMTQDKKGNIYVADINKNEIQKISFS